MSTLYAAPMYLVISSTLCVIYGMIEFGKDKGNLNTQDKLILSAWCIISLIVSSVIAGISGEMMEKSLNPMYILLTLILVCATLSVSSSLIYWS